MLQRKVFSPGISVIVVALALCAAMYTYSARHASGGMSIAFPAAFHASPLALGVSTLAVSLLTLFALPWRSGERSLS